MSSIERTIINVAEVSANMVSSRDIADTLKNAIMRAKTRLVDLDFQKVEFISRSAAHELLLIKEDLSRKFLSKKELSFININKDVSLMLRVIAANRAAPKNESKQQTIERSDLASILKEITI